MPIQRALLSVFDKSGLLPFARALAERGIELLSTGGTYRALQEEGLPVRSIEEFTGSPEVMAGRVKTLHPRVHGGILARRGQDEGDLERLGAGPIDLVVVNLYPFERTLRSGAPHDEIIENIDIGGPAMLRSAAKNHAHVAVVCDPMDYAALLAELASSGNLTPATRRRLAAKVFAHTAAYDGLIASYLSSFAEDGTRAEYPRYWFTASELAYPLRYGENPHQSGAFYQERGVQPGALALAESLGAGGKELSFNNLVDVNAALEAVREFEEPAAVVVKHTNPCGVATARDVTTAYRLARDADALSAFGGIVALNRPVDGAVAALLIETFLECVVAPSFDDEALALLRTKKNLRLLATGLESWTSPLDIKRVGGGFVVQQRDATGAGEVHRGKVVTRRAPTAEELASLEFAWRVCKHVKSNAIVLARGAQTVGVGAGQMSRVVSVEIACAKAGELAQGSVLASDAFFPFADGVEAALRRGVTAIAQPGGSMRDAEVIAAADAAGAAMVFTGTRHFRH
jgi:phosphoribosylaminoimidazolecarboxamide formyltransferase/IMP cyclohydrolase